MGTTRGTCRGDVQGPLSAAYIYINRTFGAWTARSRVPGLRLTKAPSSWPATSVVESPTLDPTASPKRENSESELQRQCSSLAEWGARISLRPPSPSPSPFFFAEDRARRTYRKLGVGPRSHSRTRNPSRRTRGPSPGPRAGSLAWPATCGSRGPAAPDPGPARPKLAG